MTLLCGGEVKQAQYFAHRHHMDQSKYRIVTKPEDLYGFIHGTLLIMVGSWRGTPNSVDVMELAKRNDLMVVSEI